MKARQFTEEQIIAVIKEGEAGAKVADLCRKYGISEATFIQLESQIFRDDGKRPETAENAGAENRHSGSAVRVAKL